MAGEDMSDEVAVYLSRLTGEAVSNDRPVALRSIQWAAFTAWARKEKVRLKTSIVGTRASFLLADLLSEEEERDTTANAAPVSTLHPTAGPVPTAAVPVGGIGIDIEDIDSLPDADDFREHPFFGETFTSAELVYCIRQPNSRSAFCGLWAAKEAIAKATGVPAAGGLRSIEIAHDALGRPIHPAGLLSISHTPRSAVAVCIANLGGQSPAAREESAETGTIETPAVPLLPRPRAPALLAATSVAALLLIAGSLLIHHG